MGIADTACKPTGPRNLPRTENNGFNQVGFHEPPPDLDFGEILIADHRFAIEHDDHTTADFKMSQDMLHPGPITVARGSSINKTLKTVTLVDRFRHRLIPRWACDCQVEAL